MTTELPHLAWLKKAASKLKTKDGKHVAVYELIVDDAAEAALKAWAKHFREHYCLDSKIDRLRAGTTKSRSKYLLDLVFPDAKNEFGPATRSGDFAEVLVADILQGLLGFWVPRTRYAEKKVRNESPKGTDIIGFKSARRGSLGSSPKDTLITVESKAQLSGTRPKTRLQDAVNDSAKDQFRLAESLNAVKRRLVDLDFDDEARCVERFQDPLGNPYVRESGAAAVFCSSVFDPAHVADTTDCREHENSANLMLIVVHARQLQKIVHALYERAANEA